MLASALLLATAYPLRWAVALFVLTAVSVEIITSEYVQIGWLRRAIDLAAWFISGEDFNQFVRLSEREFTRGWLLLPSMGLWVASAVFWISLGFACVVAASSRARDH